MRFGQYGNCPAVGLWCCPLTLRSGFQCRDQQKNESGARAAWNRCDRCPLDPQRAQNASVHPLEIYRVLPPLPFVLFLLAALLGVPGCGDRSAPQEGCVHLNKRGNGKGRRTNPSDSEEKQLFESGMETLPNQQIR